jgi:hypothetical protein
LIARHAETLRPKGRFNQCENALKSEKTSISATTPKEGSRLSM